MKIMRKKKLKRVYQGLNFDDMRWCIDNDFQVYIKPVCDVYQSNGKDCYVMNGKYQIAVRRLGIKTEGRDYMKVNGVKVVSKEKLSELVFDTQVEAHNNLNYVYEHLRTKYG